MNFDEALETYLDLGWINSARDSLLTAMKRCKELGHTMKERDVSLFKGDGSHTIFYCPDCEFKYHQDSSD